MSQAKDRDQDHTLASGEPPSPVTPDPEPQEGLRFCLAPRPEPSFAWSRVGLGLQGSKIPPSPLGLTLSELRTWSPRSVLQTPRASWRQVGQPPEAGQPAEGVSRNRKRGEPGKMARG